MPNWIKSLYHFASKSLIKACSQSHNKTRRLQRTSVELRMTISTPLFIHGCACIGGGPQCFQNRSFRLRTPGTNITQKFKYIRIHITRRSTSSRMVIATFGVRSNSVHEGRRGTTHNWRSCTRDPGRLAVTVSCGVDPLRPRS